MGYITMRNYSGREVFACEIGKPGCRQTGCTAHRCPYGWCQKYYICKSCWALPEVKALFTKRGGNHENCKHYVAMSAAGVNPFEKEIKFSDGNGKVGTLSEMINGTIK